MSSVIMTIVVAPFVGAMTIVRMKAVRMTKIVAKKFLLLQGNLKSLNIITIQPKIKK